jgi:putative flavoprotein involved in K+ transport
MGPHEPNHRAGIVESVPGLYFTGLHFLYALSSTMIQGVGRDAKRIVQHLSSRVGKLKAAG